LLALSVQPCNDNVFSRDDQGHSMQKIAHLDRSSQDTESDTNDECSPFCICSCCGSNPAPTIVYTLPVASPKVLEGVAEMETQYKTPYKSTRTYSIWQPPKA